MTNVKYMPCVWLKETQQEVQKITCITGRLKQCEEKVAHYSGNCLQAATARSSKQCSVSQPNAADHF